MSRLDSIHARMAAEGISASLFPKGLVGDDLVPRHIHVNLKSGKSVRIIRDGSKFAIGDMEPVRPEDVVGIVRTLDPKIVGPFNGPSYILGYRLKAIHTSQSNFRLGWLAAAEVPGLDTETLFQAPESARDHALATARTYAAERSLSAPVVTMSASAPTGLGFTGSDVLILVERVYPDPWKP